MSINAERVKKYHEKLSELKVRFPNDEKFIEEIRERAKNLGFIIEKGVKKGEGNVNAYILHLIKADLDKN